jgi:hypothetical protein
MSYREESAALARRNGAIAIAAKMHSENLVSGKAIDLWSLAVCSFCLTVLCHSLANVPQAPAASSSVAASTSTPSTGADVPASLKLFTLTSSRPEVKGEKK